MRGIYLKECADCHRGLAQGVHRMDDGPYIPDDLCRPCYIKRTIVIHSMNQAHRRAWHEKAYYGTLSYHRGMGKALALP